MKNFILFLFVPFMLFAQQTDFEKAEAYFEKGKFDEARPLFERYYDKHPDDLESQEYLGDIASNLKNWDVAISYYERLVEAVDDSAEYHYKYGGAMGMKALEVSRFRALTYIGTIKDEFKTAALLDPKHIDTRWALVKLYLQLPGILGGSEQKAQEYAQELMGISPVDGYLAKAFIEEQNDDYTDAEAYYRKAVAVGGSVHTYEQLIAFYEKNNKPEAALETAQEAYQKHQKNPQNYLIGKIVAENNLQPELGIISLKRYIDRHTSEDKISKSYAYLRLAQIYRNMGDKDLAMRYVDKALSTKPNFEEALAVRADIKNL